MEPTDKPDQQDDKPTAQAVGLTIWVCACLMLMAAGVIIWVWQTYTWLRTGSWPAATVNGVLSNVSITVPQTGSDRVDWIGDSSMAFVLVLLGFALLAAAAASGGSSDP